MMEADSKTGGIIKPIGAAMMILGHIVTMAAGLALSFIVVLLILAFFFWVFVVEAEEEEEYRWDEYQDMR